MAGSQAEGQGVWTSGKLWRVQLYHWNGSDAASSKLRLLLHMPLHSILYGLLGINNQRYISELEVPQKRE